MFELGAQTLTHLLAAYGYWAIFALIAIESAGIPLPGESMLLAASVYAGVTHQLNVALVVGAAAAGAIFGDNMGYLGGRAGGYRLLLRYRHALHMDDQALNVGRYMFMRYGPRVVFFGRFVAFLRVWAALFAGTYLMPWRKFLLFNAAGGIAWATRYGCGGYLLGNRMAQLGGLAGLIALGNGATIMVATAIVMRRQRRRLAAESVLALPGPVGLRPLSNKGTRHLASCSLEDAAA